MLIDMAEGMPKAEREKLAAKTVNEIMKSK